MNNQISCLPTTITQCHNLMVLSVDHNRLTSLPNRITGLKSLVDLSASGNLLEYLPYDLNHLENLASLILDNNPRLLWIPATVFWLPVLTTISMNRFQTILFVCTFVSSNLPACLPFACLLSYCQSTECRGE